MSILGMEMEWENGRIMKVEMVSYAIVHGINIILRIFSKKIHSLATLGPLYILYFSSWNFEIKKRSVSEMSMHYQFLFFTYHVLKVL
jgi:hypothetical protein